MCSLGLLCLVLAAFCFLTLLDATAAQAQEQAAPEVANVELPAEPAAAAAAPAAPAAGGDAAAEGSTAPRESLLSWFYRSLGIRYVVSFLVLSFLLVAMLIMNILAARRDNIVPVALVEGFEQLLNEKKYQEAYEFAKNDESFLGQVLSAGLAKLSAGYAQAIEAMQEVGEEENMKLEHRLSYIALIGSLSPMVGLLGTVDGMVQSFRVIATSSATPKASELADGISMALITTLVGLVLAIPAVAIFNILKNRFARLVLEVGIVSEGLMSRFSSVSSAKKS
ncbi:MAG: MotA/TolQ/ExbB proton channel family protein [Pirellulales bacterium]|nr:MotA/TolQ/ExbB proton channel family protein [Pirellulales bacterium]